MTKAAEAVAIWRRLGEVARVQECSPVRLLPRFLWLYGPGRYSPNEIFRLRLLGIPAGKLRDYISKERMRRIQMRLNPVELTGQTEDKALFYRLCAQAALPTPPVLAELDLTLPAVARQRLAALADADLVVKPSQGYHGLGVLLLTHTGERFTANDGVVYTVDEVLGKLAQGPSFRDWLVQSRVFNHPDVCGISPSSALQTLRVVTFVDDDGAPHIIASQWRLARPEAATDNFRGGVDGNLLCNVNVESGRIATALRLSPSGWGMEALTHHPASGVALDGLAVPYWAEVAELSLRAALAMLPTRSIGWDIGVTPAGPLVIEANRYWDPQNADAGMGARLRFMAARTSRFRFG